MSDQDTTIGVGGPEFPATAWSLVLLPRGIDPAERKRKLELLARRYWKPIYFYLRAKWRRSNEDAKDLTQRFFLWMMQTDFLGKVHEDRGRFRNFVRVALERFLFGEHDAEKSLKRGGGRAALDLDFVTGLDVEPASPALPAEELLKEHWRRALIDEALRRLKECCEAESKLVHYRLFEDFYLAPEPGPSYEELSRRHRVSPGDVGNYLARTRSRYRAILEALVSDEVLGFRELKEEFEELFGSDS